MKCKRNTYDPDRVENGGRGLKIPFTNESTSNGEKATSLSDCENEPQMGDDRVLLSAADRPVKEDADTEQGYQEEKPAKRW
jgi:hypothetical protein